MLGVGWVLGWCKKENLLLLGHEALDELFVVDLAVGVLSTLEDDLDLLDGQFLTESGENVTDLSAHNGTVTLLYSGSIMIFYTINLLWKPKLLR